MSTWREAWAGQVRNPEALVRFVDAVGCCTLNPLPDYPDFPHQSAVLGPQDPDTPDRWFWKDDLHIERRLYYTHLFGKQPGYIAYALLPAFIATNGAVADELLLTGKLSPEADLLYRAIDEHGPIPIREVKRLLTPEARKGANTLLQRFERQFIVTKTDITGRTRGTYGYVWELVERWMPEMLADADRLGRAAATNILYEHFAAYGIPADSPFYRKVLGWDET